MPTMKELLSPLCLRDSVNFLLGVNYKTIP